jgi:DNA-binding CsgD family transcriptional regulator
MDGVGDILTNGQSREVRALHAQSGELVEAVASRALEGDGDGRVRRLVGLAELVAQLRVIEPKATASSRVLQPRYAYDPEDPGVALTRDARARGIETQLITRPGTVRTHPLLASIFPRTLLGPCFLGAMVVDERLAIIGGPDDLEGNRTAWFTSLPELVDGVCDLWRATVPLCEPILPPGTKPPLTERQLDVARLVCVGEKDKAIARLLDLSLRTVEREVSAILGELGARSRTEAVLLMRGRGVNGGTVDAECRARR